MKKMDFDESFNKWNFFAKNHCINNLKNVCDVCSHTWVGDLKLWIMHPQIFSFFTWSELFIKNLDELVKAAADLAIKYNIDI